MKITDIKPQARSKDRVSIYVDGKYSFGLAVWQLAILKLHVGDEIAEAEATKLKHQSEYGKLYDRTLVWLSLRKHSEWEIDQYLRRKTTDEKLKNAVKAGLQDNTYIDDEAFARAWVESRQNRKGSSKRKLFAELKGKRVPQELIDKALNDAEDDVVAAKKVILKKQKLSRYQDRDKFMRHLAQNGFNYDTIKQAFTELEEENEQR